jgi:hypothetical protein
MYVTVVSVRAGARGLTAGRLGAGVASCLIDCRPRPAPFSFRPHDICARRARSPQAVSVSADRKVCGLPSTDHPTPCPAHFLRLASQGWIPADDASGVPRQISLRSWRNGGATRLRDQLIGQDQSSGSSLLEPDPAQSPPAVLRTRFLLAIGGSTDELSTASPKNT